MSRIQRATQFRSKALGVHVGTDKPRACPRNRSGPNLLEWAGQTRPATSVTAGKTALFGVCVVGVRRTIEELKTLLSQHMSSANEKGCWLWKGKVNGAGYGTLCGLGQHGTHRVAYAAYIGDPGHSHVLHRCDEPRCCNPAHLWLGDHRENMADCIAKGRHTSRTISLPRGANHWTRQPGVKLVGLRGEDCPTSKLTSNDVAVIRSVYAEGFTTQRELGAKFSVSQIQISRIVRGERWPN